jgi:ABC-type cobalamin transport system ATPase subunit
MANPLHLSCSGCKRLPEIKSLEAQREIFQGAASYYKQWNDKLKRVMERLSRCRQEAGALALAIFLGLAASNKDSGTFGFVLMDDPSQSLDSEHKKQLVRVLNEVASQKRLVLSTMDREFRDCLAAELTKAKTEYVFEAWTPEKGPTITLM